MKIATTCPMTLAPLYVSDIKPSLVHTGACGDWGYHPKVEFAVEMTERQAKICINDMNITGRKPQIIESAGHAQQLLK